MNDSTMTDLIETLTCVFEDYFDKGESPTLVASVMFAVAIKQLRANLDDEEFYAILDEIKNTEMHLINSEFHYFSAKFLATRFIGRFMSPYFDCRMIRAFFR